METSTELKINPQVDKKIKKGIAKGIKYLQQYRLKVVDYEHRKKSVYDGGASILLSFMQGRYAVDFGFENNCGNLVKCAQDYSIDHHKPMFSYSDATTDLFETNFLRDIYLQKHNKYPLKNIIQKMEQYIQSGNGIINQLMPILGITSQRHVRYLNVGLGLFGLLEKNEEKVGSNKMFKHLKRRVCRELADIFNNKENYDPLYLDMVKTYALFLLNLLGEEKRIEQDAHKQFIVCLLKSQNSMGHWIHTDNYDTVNEINNTILTIFAVCDLLNFLEKNNLENQINVLDEKESENENKNNKEDDKIEIEHFNQENKNINKNKTEKNKTKKNNIKMNNVEGFAGGFLTPDNMDNLFSERICMGSVIQLIIFFALIAMGIFILMKVYRSRNI
jgi:hypothetical protein